MTVSALLMRFAGLYIALMIGASLFVNLIGGEHNSGLNAGALVGAVLISCNWFCTKNRRVIDSKEKMSAFFGMLTIDIGIQIIAGLGAMAANGAMLEIEVLLTAAIFIGVLHGVGIYFMIGLANKMYEKQAAKGK